MEENSFPEIYEDINDACDALDKLIRNYDTSFVSPYRSDLIDIPEHLNNVFVYHMIGDMFFGILRRKIVPKKKKEEIREIPNLEEIASLLQKDYKFKKVSVVEEISNCPYNVKYYPQDDDTITYFLSLILKEHCNEHVLLNLHKEVYLDRYVIYMAVRELETSKKHIYKYVVKNSEKGIVSTSTTYTSFDDVCDAMDKQLDYSHDSIGKPNWKPRMTREEYRKYMGYHTATTYDFFEDGATTDTYILNQKEV